MHPALILHRPTGRVLRLTLALASLSALVGRIRAGEYQAEGSSRRFRAVQRRRTLAAARVGFLIIAAAAAFDVAMLVDRDPTKTPVLIGLNGGVSVLSVVAWAMLRRQFRHHPEAVASVVTLALVAATVATGVILPELAVETVGYLLLLPGLIALILPWQTRTHVRWLLGYAVLALGYLAAGPSERLTAEDRGDLITVCIVAMGASLAGQVLLQRAQIRNFAQLQKINLLRRRADADMAELARVHEALETTARTDPLTGAGNRIRLAEDLRAARARMNRLGHSHGIVVVDLDHFKQINDRLGHLAGDGVLRRVAAALQATTRADDHVYRFGGEEFLVVLRLPSSGDLAIAAERLRKGVEALAIPHPANGPTNVVTVSVGAAFVGPDNLDQADDDWFALADAALYRAKDRGRNRVELAGS